MFNGGGFPAVGSPEITEMQKNVEGKMKKNTSFVNELGRREIFFPTMNILRNTYPNSSSNNSFHVCEACLISTKEQNGKGYIVAVLLFAFGYAQFREEFKNIYSHCLPFFSLAYSFKLYDCANEIK